MTDRLYYKDQYLQNFSARIIETRALPDGRWGLILDRTAFYPEGGGQPGDRGYLNDIEVLEVVEEDGQIVHITPEIPALDARGCIDWGRRFDHMQQHSGEHILCGAFVKILGAVNTGFHLGQYSSQIDLELNGLSPGEVTAVEREANQIVFADLPIPTLFLQTPELGEYRLRKSPEKDFSRIRLVSIKDFDCCPCGGTHVSSTGQVGLIKIRYWERKKNGVRIDFVCGARALEDYQHKNLLAYELSSRFCVPPQELPAAYDRLQEKQESLLKELAAARKELSRLQAQELYHQGKIIKDCRLVTHQMEEGDPQSLTILAGYLTAYPGAIALLGAANNRLGKGYLTFAAAPGMPLDLGKILKQVLPLIDGRGGGTALMAQGGTSSPEKLGLALDAAGKAVLDSLGE